MSRVTLLSAAKHSYVEFKKNSATTTLVVGHNTDEDVVMVRGHLLHRHTHTQHTRPGTTIMSSDVARKTCRVCAASAYNHNLGCLTCESCKVFFRRAVLKRKQYKCKYSNNCQILSTGRKCTACRLAKCLEQGMRKEFINLKITRDKEKRESSETNAGKAKILNYQPKKVFSLTNYEKKCLADIREKLKVFPEERDILATGNVTRIESMQDCMNSATSYLKPMVKFANSIEAFRSIAHAHQVQLVKLFFNYFLTIRATFNLLPNGLDFPDEAGTRCYLYNWQVSIEAIEKYELLKGNSQAMAASRADFISGRCWKLVELVKKALDNDTMIRDIFSVVLLLQPNPSMTSCYEYIKCHATFFTTLLRRYLLVRHQNVAAANEQFLRVIELVGLCQEMRSYSSLMLDALDANGLSQLIVELYQS